MQKPIDVTLLVGELRDSGQYGAEGGVSATTLVELFRLLPLVRHLPYYVERVAEMELRSGSPGGSVADDPRSDTAKYSGSK